MRTNKTGKYAVVIEGDLAKRLAEAANLVGQTPANYARFIIGSALPKPTQ